jgi:excisionase family DNA binding protein
MKKIYTIKELKDVLHLGERTIFKYLKEGRLSGSKHGKWRFTEEDVNNFLKSGRKSTKRKDKK